MKKMIILAAFSALAVVQLTTGNVFAAAAVPDSGGASTTSTFTNSACAGAQQVDASACGDTAATALQSLLRLVVNILTIVVGFTAVVMIIVGGFKYITATGDSGKLSSAKSTIIYAIIGLVIVAMAQVIVHFTLAKANAATTICTSKNQKNCVQPTKKN